MNKILAICIFSCCISGCESVNANKYFGNRITCSVAKDKAYVNSLWGIFGLSVEIVPEDSKLICADKGKKVEQ